MQFTQVMDLKDNLAILAYVYLEYITLGQSLDTLSGGKDQRLKLCKIMYDMATFMFLMAL
jgi:excinuclease UvrABC ATPase subunit